MVVVLRILLWLARWLIITGHSIYVDGFELVSVPRRDEPVREENVMSAEQAFMLDEFVARQVPMSLHKLFVQERRTISKGNDLDGTSGEVYPTPFTFRALIRRTC